MTKSYSLYLDVLRVFAALVVLFSHLAFSWASGGYFQWMRDLNIGSDFVIVFFVLSGLVIAHTTTVKDKSLGDYSQSRISRLYSVAIPAIVLSYVCYAIATGMWGVDLPARDVLGELFHSLTFTNYAWFSQTRLPGNGPFWSVGYEFWYYALFGAWIYLQGRYRVYAISAICLIIGPPILLLMPTWLLGVMVYRSLQDGFHHTLNLRRGVIFAVAPWIIYAACLGLGVAPLLKDFTQTHILGGYTAWSVLHFSDEFLWNNLIGLLVAIHFLGMARLTLQETVIERFAGAIRWISGRTFSLYLFHMPVLTLISRHPAYDALNPAHIVANSVITLAVCLLLAEFTERRVHVWRDAILVLRQRMSGKAAPLGSDLAR